MFGKLSVCGALVLTLGAAIGGGLARPGPRETVVVARLRCEYRTNPLGLDVPRPRLSWILLSDRRGVRQTAYQVLVARSESLLASGEADLWDSGKVESDASIQVDYTGPALRSRKRAYWKVRVWDQDGHPSAWSPAAWWEMGLLHADDWHARWIGLEALGAAGPAPCPYLRKRFTLANPPRRARVYSTALGLYELWLNGRRVGADHLTPGWTDYNQRLQYQTYDVTELLQTGENVLGAILADGWFRGKVGWVGRDQGFYGPGPARLLAQLEIDTEAGRQVVTTDTSWKGTRGPIVSSDLLDGEIYDGRKEMPDWDRPGFDDASWGSVQLLEDGSSRQLVADIAPPIQVTQEIRPLSVNEPFPNVFIFDMGQNMVGWVRLRVRGPAGTEVRLRFGEMLNPNGLPYTLNERAARCNDRYLLKGEGDEVFEPRFTTHGFRYVQVVNYPGRPNLDTITGCVAQSAMATSGHFVCSSPLINRLQQCIVWSQRGNSLGIPTDCPQRDERLGWMGDAQLFARTACFNMDGAAFFTKWLRDVTDAQATSGALSDVAPRLGAFNDAAPGWGDAGIIVPWSVSLCYGDRRLLAEHYDAMVRWIDYVWKANPDLLWVHNVGSNYGDWLARGSPTDKGVLATAYFAHSTQLMARIATALGHTEEARRYAALSEAIRAAFNRAYVGPDGTIRGDTQTSYVLALRFDLLPEALRTRAADRLLASIRRSGGLTTGYIGTAHLLPALTDAGHLDVAYELLNRESFPSWGYMINQGATTLWERWDSWTPERGFQDPGMNSFNHATLGAVGDWIYRTIGGIDVDPDRPGYKHILIRPRPGGGLTSARAEYDSPYGPIASEWRIQGRIFRLRVRIPPNATATVTLLSPNRFTQAGQSMSVGAARPPQNGKGATYQIGAGSYEFTAQVEVAMSGPPVGGLPQPVTPRPPPTGRRRNPER